jgi:hypothetical protein
MMRLLNLVQYNYPNLSIQDTKVKRIPICTHGFLKFFFTFFCASFADAAQHSGTFDVKQYKFYSILMGYEDETVC